jgi:threonine aldolase
VIAASTGHVALHEAGAIEASGHKVITLPADNGKITAAQVKEYVDTFYADDAHEHMAFPGMVYISYPTEYGTLYSKAELVALSATCHALKLPLFIDGARLGYGLMSPASDITLPEIAELADVFYIGGTKVGALFGEAVVFTKNNMPKYFMTTIKQHGALLAKGRVAGVQFLTLFSDNLYFEISRHAIQLAEKLKAGFIEKGYQVYLDSPTNQQFFIMDNDKMQALQEKVKFAFWEKYDDTHTVVRFATSWATKEANVDTLLTLI